MITDYRDPAYWRQRRPAPPAWPGTDPIPEVLTTDPIPADAPPVPNPVLQLQRLASAWETRIGYSRGPERAVRVGTYKLTEAYGLWAARHPVSGWRFAAIYGRTVGKAWAWRAITIWTPGQGGRFHDATVTDLKEWLAVGGDVGKPWFKAVAARVADQQDRARAAARNRPGKTKEGAS